MRIFILLCSFFLFLATCSTGLRIDDNTTLTKQIKPLTIFLVRHAEKNHGPNPSLTKVGQERAEKLSQMLEKVELDAIFSTNYKRTQATALPTANHQGLDVISYDPSELEALSETLLTNYLGKNVLVVGHSNTTPQLCGLLEGISIYDSFDEQDYGNLVMVTAGSDGSKKVVFLRF